MVHGQTDPFDDPTFQPALTFAPEIVMPLADGRICIASSKETFTVGNHRQLGLARLLANGSIDPAFDVGTGIDTGAITALDVLTDGRVVLTGTFPAIKGIARPTLAVLHTNGALDLSFQTDAALLAPIPALRYPLLDGRWIVGTVANERLSFSRCTAEGRLDTGHRSNSLDLRPVPGDTILSPRFRELLISSRDDLGRQHFGLRFWPVVGEGSDNY
jgi:hypothetical protein